MDIIAYVKSHWSVIDWIMLPGALAGYLTTIQNALQAHGYMKAESVCKRIGNFLSFLTDVISGILAKKQGKLNEKNTPSSIVSKP